MAELLRPWKLATLAIGLALLIAGSGTAPDWDTPISIIMAGFAYLLAPWSMRVIVERRWKHWPLMLLTTWWTVDGCYALYWGLKSPQALSMMRDVNAPASLCLFLICGLLWYRKGKLWAGLENLQLKK